MTSGLAFLAALSDGDEATAHAILDRHPETAYAVGSGGHSTILLALYRGLPSLAEAIAARRAVDVFEAAALGRCFEMCAWVLASKGETGDWSHAMSVDGWTALHLAAFFGRGSAVELLLQAGAAIDPVSRNAMANTPLCAALAGRGPESVVPLLIAGNANVNSRAANGVTPLHLAASRGADALVRLLLDQGADAAAQLDDGSTPADVARARGFPDTAALFPG